MKVPLLFLFVGAGLWFATMNSASSGDAGRALLDEVMDKPGSWNQICMLSRAPAFEPPVPVFSGRLTVRYFELGKDEAQRLQEKRRDVVPVLVDLLHGMDLSKPPAETRGPKKSGFENARAGFKADWLNQLHLDIIRETNAVETLPELLRLEAQLQSRLEALDKDPKADLPDLPLDAPAAFQKAGDEDKRKQPGYWESKEHERDVRIFTCRVFQREILGTMTELLRNEAFAPMKEKFEPLREETKARQLAAARAALDEAQKKLAEAEKLFATTTKEERREISQYRAKVGEAKDELRWRSFSPGGERPGFEADYTSALRGQIRAFVESFLQSVPPEKRKGATAMPKHEKER
jgi:hypothetical protein